MRLASETTQEFAGFHLRDERRRILLYFPVPLHVLQVHHNKVDEGLVFGELQEKASFLEQLPIVHHKGRFEPRKREYLTEVHEVSLEQVSLHLQVFVAEGLAFLHSVSKNILVDRLEGGGQFKRDASQIVPLILDVNQLLLSLDLTYHRKQVHLLLFFAVIGQKEQIERVCFLVEVTVVVGERLRFNVQITDADLGLLSGEIQKASFVMSTLREDVGEFDVFLEFLRFAPVQVHEFRGVLLLDREGRFLGFVFDQQLVVFFEDSDFDFPLSRTVIMAGAVLEVLFAIVPFLGFKFVLSGSQCIHSLNALLTKELEAVDLFHLGDLFVGPAFNLSFQTVQSNDIPTEFQLGLVIFELRIIGLWFLLAILSESSILRVFVIGDALKQNQIFHVEFCLLTRFFALGSGVFLRQVVFRFHSDYVGLV